MSRSAAVEGTRSIAVADDPVRGILLLLGALLLFACADMLAKVLSAGLSPVEIAWLRYIAFSLLLVPLLATGGLGTLEVRRPGLQVLRGLGILGSAVLFISAVSFVPLAEATATSFTSPVFITILSVIVLGERPGIRRWSAIAAGIVGMVMVVRPGGSGFQWASLLPVGSAASWAVAMVVTRQMAQGERVLPTMGWTAMTGLVVMSGMLPFFWVVPTREQLLLGLLAGTVNTTAQWLTLMAYRCADASLLAPISYSQLVWAVILGIVVFGAVPDLWTFAGAAVIIGSGIYIAHRERLVRRAPA
ncbi:MAG TPA: DMT family transporter [Stellaceae bacterium]|nr:DMT family transporter [Stellaceae bacterium]